MRKAITGPDIPTAGPYSPAIRAGDFLFISGQIPIDSSGALVAGGIEEQARQAMENLKAVLAAAGASLKDLVRVTIYLVDMDDFAVVNRVYGSYFDLEPPARACVAVKELPKGARVEIEAIAYLGD
ncbi:RidA family protein [Candidatus Bipolaricaulota sp. J31]